MTTAALTPREAVDALMDLAANPQPGDDKVAIELDAGVQAALAAAIAKAERPGRDVNLSSGDLWDDVMRMQLLARAAEHFRERVCEGLGVHA